MKGPFLLLCLAVFFKYFSAFLLLFRPDGRDPAGNIEKFSERVADL